MSCPTCDHTMTNLWTDPKDKSVFWCPRCGTIKVRWHRGKEPMQQTEVPKLVGHFHEVLDAEILLKDFFAYVEGGGSAKEATTPPEERTTP